MSPIRGLKNYGVTSPMKRYLVFGIMDGDVYGGIEDITFQSNNIEEAQKAAKNRLKPCPYYHGFDETYIFDRIAGIVVEVNFPPKCLMIDGRKTK